MDTFASSQLVELLGPGRVSEMLPLSRMVNAREFEYVAQARMTASAYDYVAAGAEDEVHIIGSPTHCGMS
jgi:hypothetical protein